MSRFSFAPSYLWITKNHKALCDHENQSSWPSHYSCFSITEHIMTFQVTGMVLLHSTFYWNISFFFQLKFFSKTTYNWSWNVYKDTRGGRTDRNKRSHSHEGPDYALEPDRSYELTCLDGNNLRDKYLLTNGHIFTSTVTSREFAGGSFCHQLPPHWNLEKYKIYPCL